MVDGHVVARPKALDLKALEYEFSSSCSLGLSVALFFPSVQGLRGPPNRLGDTPEKSAPYPPQQSDTRNGGGILALFEKAPARASHRKWKFTTGRSAAGRLAAVWKGAFGQEKGCPGFPDGSHPTKELADLAKALPFQDADSFGASRIPPAACGTHQGRPFSRALMRSSCLPKASTVFVSAN
jgi:hypothetical protein